MFSRTAPHDGERDAGPPQTDDVKKLSLPAQQPDSCWQELQPGWEREGELLDPERRWLFSEAEPGKKKKGLVHLRGAEISAGCSVTGNSCWSSAERSWSPHVIYSARETRSVCRSDAREGGSSDPRAQPAGR